MSAGARASSACAAASAPAATKSSTTVRWPLRAAMWHGVRPLWSTAATPEGSCRSSNSTMGRRPLEATKWIGAAPWLSRRAGSARSESRILQASLWPREDARWSGVRNQNCSNVQFTSAPASTRGRRRTVVLCWIASFMLSFRLSTEWSLNQCVMTSWLDTPHTARSLTQHAAHLAQSVNPQSLKQSDTSCSSSSKRRLPARRYICKSNTCAKASALTPAARTQTCKRCRQTALATARLCNSSLSTPRLLTVLMQGGISSASGKQPKRCTTASNTPRLVSLAMARDNIRETRRRGARWMVHASVLRNILP
mmetsp:Transcript_12641/g.39849  ORF Transcript_12641/g.39849 Transcript_12641/m.39849 type:complete len:310 (+) Transcript_12641:470-1399(+)